MFMATSETLLFVMSVIVLLMGIVVAVMMWQSRRRRQLLRRREEIIEREQCEVDRMTQQALSEGWMIEREQIVNGKSQL